MEELQTMNMTLIPNGVKLLAESSHGRWEFFAHSHSQDRYRRQPQLPHPKWAGVFLIPNGRAGHYTLGPEWGVGPPHPSRTE